MVGSPREQKGEQRDRWTDRQTEERRGEEDRKRGMFMVVMPPGAVDYAQSGALGPRLIAVVGTDPS